MFINWNTVYLPSTIAYHIECVTVELANQSNTNITIQYGYSVKDADGKEVVHIKSYTKEFDARDSEVIFGPLATLPRDQNL